MLAHYAGDRITLRHFEAQYARDVGSWTAAQSDAPDAYSSFLSAYVDYRLKVKAARDADIDQDPALRAQLQRYRRQTARSQLRVDSVLAPIMRALHDQRAETDSHVSYADAYDDLRRRAERLPRTRAAERAFLTQLRNRYVTRVDTAALIRSLGIPGPGTDPLNRPAAELLRALHRSSTPVVIVQDSVYTPAALAAFWKDTPTEQHTSVRGVLDAFTHHVVMNYVAHRLEHVDPSFRRQVQDYWEGLLVFDLMQDSVWTPALRDTAGQIAYFKQHRDQYEPSPSTHATRRGLATQPSPVPLQATELPRLASRPAPGLASVHLDAVLVAGEGFAPSGRVLPLRDGAARQTIGRMNENNDAAEQPDRAQRIPPVQFTDVQHEVIRDFQAYRERIFVKRLRERYHTQLFPDRLQAAFQRAPVHPTAALAPLR